MRVKLFSDEDFYIGKFAPDMRRLGYDVVDVLDEGLIRKPDDTLLECAINDKKRKDYWRILASHLDRSGSDSIQCLLDTGFSRARLPHHSISLFQRYFLRIHNRLLKPVGKPFFCNQK